MSTAVTLTLSKADSKVLSAIFDPESAPEAPTISVNPSLPSDPHITSPDQLSSLKACEVSAIKLIESLPPPALSKAVRNIPDGETERAFSRACDILTSLTNEHPTYASAYNNRAQLMRWRYGDHDTLAQRPNQCIDSKAAMAITTALQDLSTAIALATPKTPGAAVSPTQAKLLAQAHTQRGGIYYAVSKDLAAGRELVVGSSSHALEVEAGESLGWEWSSWDKDRFEEEGSRCFFLGGVYGNEIGKAMAVHANPYARLCGAIVSEALRGEGVAT